jgi:hypothetical protein
MSRQALMREIETLPPNLIEVVFHYVVSMKQEKQDSVKGTVKAPLVYSELSREEFDAEMEKRMKSLEEGRVISAKEVRERMQRRYGL